MPPRHAAARVVAALPWEYNVQMDQRPSLADAIAHLKSFRASFYAGDFVDPVSSLSVADLDVIIEHCDKPQADVVADALGNLA